jgi:hypothetical protein
LNSLVLVAVLVAVPVAVPMAVAVAVLVTVMQFGYTAQLVMVLNVFALSVWEPCSPSTLLMPPLALVVLLAVLVLVLEAELLVLVPWLLA